MRWRYIDTFPQGAGDIDTSAGVLFSGPSAALAYQLRLKHFQSDASVPLARYENGHLAHFDPSGDGGGMGDVLQITAKEVAAALALGQRYTSPHCAGVWRYATVAARADLCTVNDGWKCVFEDILVPLHHDHRLSTRTGLMSLGQAVVGVGAGRDKALLAHGLHPSQWEEGECKVRLRSHRGSGRDDGIASTVSSDGDEGAFSGGVEAADSVEVRLQHPRVAPQPHPSLSGHPLHPRGPALRQRTPSTHRRTADVITGAFTAGSAGLFTHEVAVFADSPLHVEVSATRP